jgi:hypothetical protein
MTKLVSQPAGAPNFVGPLLTLCAPNSRSGLASPPIEAPIMNKNLAAG